MEMELETTFNHLSSQFYANFVDGLDDISRNTAQESHVRCACRNLRIDLFKPYLYYFEVSNYMVASGITDSLSP